MPTESFTSNLFSLRPAQACDLAYINSYAFAEGMDNMPGTDNLIVAVNAEDIPVGFIRFVADPIDKTVGYVNPVVVCKPWRRFGVGRVLMDAVHAQFSEVRLVARGASVPFYRSLGYVETDWVSVDSEIADDCDGCPMLTVCHPLPMHFYPKTQF